MSAKKSAGFTYENTPPFRNILKLNLRNGSWFDADGGAIPDVYIRDPQTFFDRDKLTEIINGIN